ncbi:hypothetical protein KQI84_11720 [bacterium]|nr:hypothetical protein [bacterium]
MARLDYDEIKKGRRRDWDKLQDPEVVKQRERDAKEEERKRRESLLRRKERERKEKNELELKTWEQTKRELKIYGLIFAAVVVVYVGFKVTTATIRKAHTAARFRSVAAEVESPGRYFDLSDPIGAWGSWRNAWYRRNIRDLYMMSSIGRQNSVRGTRRDEATYMEEEQQKMDEGRLSADLSVALQFDDPEIVRAPRHPNEGDLAVFKSQPIIREAVIENPTQWTVAFAWSKEKNQWQLVDVRQAQYWRDKWSDVGDIKAVVYRPAQRQSLLD